MRDLGAFPYEGVTANKDGKGVCMYLCIPYCYIGKLLAVPVCLYAHQCQALLCVCCADVRMTYAEWAKLIQQNFERRFWVPLVADEDEQREGEDAKYIHRRGIYKDSVGATHRFADFQLRPNYPIAMVVVSYCQTLECFVDFCEHSWWS